MRTCLLALVVAACGASVPALPGQGGPRWIELTTPHFTLWTDTSQERARELVREMEHLRQVVVGTSFQSVSQDARAFVVAVRDEAELHAYMSDRFEAMAFPPAANALRQALVVLAATRSRAGEARIEAHELAHVISYTLIHEQPRWFAEGMAKYFETVTMTDHGADIGREPVRDDGRPMVLHHLISLRSMLACKTLACADAGFYATAWALFTYLANTHVPELAHYMELIADGHGDRAFGEAFPIAVDQLQQDLRQWITAGSHTIRHYNVQFMNFTVAERTLGEADIYAVRALLASHVGARPREQVLAEIDRSLALEPTNVIANVLALAMSRPITPAAAHASAAAHPDDWRAWWLVAQAGNDHFARDKACSLAATNPAIAPPMRCPAPKPHEATKPDSSSPPDSATPTDSTKPGSPDR